jgi:heme exporter protein CcmD
MMEASPLVGEDITHFVMLAYGFTGVMLLLMLVMTIGGYTRVRARLTKAEQSHAAKDSE